MSSENDDSWSSSCESEEVQKIVLHVYDDESKEFTSLTTYHGMIRIYTSKTWPSRIFWTVVVVTCLTLFMIQGGVLLKFYHSHPTTFKMSNFQISSQYFPAVSICPAGFRTNNELYYLIVEKSYDNVFSNKLGNVSTRSIIENHSYNCEDVIDHIQFGSTNISSFCKFAKRLVTDTGICFTLRSWKKSSSMNVNIKFRNDFNENFLLRLHDNYEKPTKTLPSFWLKPKSSSKIQFSVSEKFSLQENDWGKCQNEQNVVYELSECFQKCELREVHEECGCKPFYADSTLYHCTLNDLKKCKRLKPRKCDCNSQCYIQEYKFQPVSITKNTRETVVKLQINSKIVKSYQQYKRFKQIDLMSYVGGVMGLFLGMSCVTLLEVFIYLFKTVFGTLNDNRHQKFVDGLLGQTSDDDDLHRSHEEIIITKKIDSHHREDKIVGFQPYPEEEQQLIENNAIKSSRRMSQLTISNDNSKGLKIQLYRPSLAVRRGSTYQGACDF